MTEAALPAASSPSAVTRRCVTLARLSLAALAALLIAWTVHLWPQWLHNPDLSHGLFTPIVFILLLHEARTRGTPRYLSRSVAGVTAASALALAGLLLIGTAGLYAAALEWSHAVVEFLLAGALCSLLVAGWLVSAENTTRLIPFNWPAAVAALSWLLSAPIPPGTYTRLTQQLQAAVTNGVLFSLQLLGIAAIQEGNVINLPHVSVGVEEACSGVRSLLSCVFAGLFLSAVLVKTPWKRAVVIGLSAPLAIAMNFVRSLLLTLLANSGVDIHGAWHDLTGFAILGVTAVLLAGLAWALERNRQADQPAGDPPRSPEIVSNDKLHGESSISAAPQAIVLTVLTLTLVALGFFVIKTRPSRHSFTAPDLLALLPARAAGWEVTTRNDLYQFSSQLQTRFLAERTYTREDAQGLTQLTVYVAYWPPGQASVSQVAAHTPDACWPGAGWVENRAQHRATPLLLGSTHLPAAQFRAFRYNEYPQNVWYWHLYGGQPIHEEVGSARELLALAWNYGFRDEEEQVFIRISSNRRWEEVANEPVLAEVAQNLHRLGL